MRTIDIATTQNVTIEYELASWRDRFLAFILDLIINSVLFMIISGILGSFVRYPSDSNHIETIISVPIFVFYTLYSEILMNGQTIGKTALGIKVVKLNGSQPTVSDFAMRWAMRMIDIVLTLGTVATLLISSSPKSQRLGCLFSGTTVIKLMPTRVFSLRDILKISSRDTYQPKYPQIIRFNEQDMLFIKNALERHRRYPNEAHALVIDRLSHRIADQLNITDIPRDRPQFLRTLINDYIVLTR